MEARKQLLGLFLMKDELFNFHQLMVLEENPFKMFKIIKQNIITLNTFFESLGRYSFLIKNNPDLKELTRSIRKRKGLINHMRNKIGGHLDDDVLIRSAQWIPYIFHEKSKENREIQIGLSYQALLEAAVNSYIDLYDNERQKEFGKEIDLNYPPDQALFLNFLEALNSDSLKWIKSAIEIIESDFEYLNDEGIIYQSRIAGFTDFNLKNTFILPDKEQLEDNELTSIAIAAVKELDKKKKIELLNKLIEELGDKIKKSS